MDFCSEVLLCQCYFFVILLLLVGLFVDDLFVELLQVQGWSWYVGEQVQLDVCFFDCSCFDMCVLIGVWILVVLFLFKFCELIDYLLVSLVVCLFGGEFFLVGEKCGGIECVSKQLVVYGKFCKLDSVWYCQFWQVCIEQVLVEFDLYVLVQCYSLLLVDGELQVVSLLGVFSYGCLDCGSVLLLG